MSGVRLDRAWSVLIDNIAQGRRVHTLSLGSPLGEAGGTPEIAWAQSAIADSLNLDPRSSSSAGSNCPTLEGKCISGVSEFKSTPLQQPVSLSGISAELAFENI
jgi:hypothetical protein